MSEPTPSRDLLSAQIRQSRAELDVLCDTLSEADLRATQVTPHWDGLAMLRHIWAWHDYILRCIDNWNGPRDWAGPIGDDFDAYNERMASAWDALGRDALAERMYAAYDRYAELLARMTDTELTQTGRGPWGRSINYLDAIGVVEHDIEHFAQIRTACRP